MNDMKMLVWLLPVLFILHDMEEIVFVKGWRRKVANEKPRKFLTIKAFGDFQDTEGFSLGVYEELLLTVLVSLLGIVTNHYELWYGFLAAYIIHLLLLHMIGGTICYRSYVPGVVTALITILPCIWVFLKADKLLQYTLPQKLIYIFLSVILVFANLKFLHKKMKNLSQLADINS